MLQTNNNTHTTSITNAYITLTNTLQKLIKNNKLKTNPIKKIITTISINIINNKTIYNLKYIKNSTTKTNINIIITKNKHIIKIQKTTKNKPFTHKKLLTLLTLTQKKIKSIITTQKTTLTN